MGYHSKIDRFSSDEMHWPYTSLYSQLCDLALYLLNFLPDCARSVHRGGSITMECERRWGS